MSQYHTFTAHDAVAYAQQFAGIDNPSELVSAQEVGDGNLNLVFKVFDRQGVSRAIVKQALPYVRCVGESWPLTLDRARLEAQTLIAHYQHSPQHTVKIHHFDPELAVMVMEDLSDHRIWRGELIANVYYPQAARQLGDYLAQVLFHTSDFYLHPHEKKAQVAQFINPAMCEITEDLFFNDPYQIHERNNYPAELEADVAALRDDAQLKLAVAAEKTRDAALAYPGYASAFLKKVWADAVGFCGSELIRRSVGLSHVADIDTIQDDAMRHECLRHAITLGRALIVLAERIDSVDELLARVRQYS